MKTVTIDTETLEGIPLTDFEKAWVESETKRRRIFRKLPYPGSDIYDVASEACREATKLNFEIRFEFNDSEVVVLPGHSEEYIVRQVLGKYDKPARFANPQRQIPAVWETSHEVTPIDPFQL